MDMLHETRRPQATTVLTVALWSYLFQVTGLTIANRRFHPLPCVYTVDLGSSHLSLITNREMAQSAHFCPRQGSLQVESRIAMDPNLGTHHETLSLSSVCHVPVLSQSETCCSFSYCKPRLLPALELAQSKPRASAMGPLTPGLSQGYHQCGGKGRRDGEMGSREEEKRASKSGTLASHPRVSRHGCDWYPMAFFCMKATRSRSPG